MPLFNLAKTETELYLEYAVYCIFLLIFVHAVIFRFALPKNTGRYLEYMYVLVISASLAQIFFSNQALSHYVEYIYGDQKFLIDRIVAVAERNFAIHCSKANPMNARWADNYCTNLKDVIHLQDVTLAEDKKSEIISRVIYNPEIFGPEQPSSFIGYFTHSQRNER
jgi:hypothetical protein